MFPGRRSPRWRRSRSPGFPAASLYWIAPAWALSCEAFFYLVFPAIMYALRGCSRGALVIVGLVSWATSLAIGAGYTVLNPDHLAVIEPHAYGDWLFMVRHCPLARLPEFVAGVAAGHVYLKAGGFPRHGYKVFLACAGVLVILLQVAGTWPHTIVNTGLWTPLLAVGICGIANPGWPARLLSWRPLAALGNASYCLYLLHEPLWTYLHRAIPGMAGQPGLEALGVLAILAASVAGYTWFERPVGARLRDLLLRPEPRGGSALRGLARAADISSAAVEAPATSRNVAP